MKRFINAVFASLVFAAILICTVGCGDNVRTTKTVTTHEQEDPQMTSPGREVVE